MCVDAAFACTWQWLFRIMFPSLGKSRLSICSSIGQCFTQQNVCLCWFILRNRESSALHLQCVQLCRMRADANTNWTDTLTRSESFAHALTREHTFLLIYICTGIGRPLWPFYYVQFGQSAPSERAIIMKLFCTVFKCQPETHMCGTHTKEAYVSGLRFGSLAGWVLFLLLCDSTPPGGPHSLWSCSVFYLSICSEKSPNVVCSCACQWASMGFNICAGNLLFLPN